MADRVVVMRAGIIEQAADPITLYERPANRFVANFIGSPAMNFFDARVEAGRVHIGTQGLPLTADEAARLPEGPVILGLRPEHMRHSETGETATLDFDALTLEPLGAHTLVLGRLEGQKVVAQVDPRTGARGGERVTVPVDMTQAHFFDPGTEIRL